MFDRVVCISLARHPERWEQFQRGLPADWPFARPKRLRAVDGLKARPPTTFAPATIPIAQLLQISGHIPDALQVTRMGGAWGCYRSHLRAIEDALTDDIEALLVFEDDAVFASDFAAQAEDFMHIVPADWHQVYFGGQHLDVPKAINDTVLRCHNVNRTHAYAIRRSMMRDAYRILSALPEDPQDAQDLHLDHRFGRLHASGKWNIYAPRQWLVGQRSGRSDTGGPGCESEAGEWWNDFPVGEPVPC